MEKALLKRDEIIRILKEHREELIERYGVKSVALFGSVARDETTLASDIDMLVEFDQPVGLFGLFALQDHLEDLLGIPVDLGTPDSLKPRLRENVLQECLPVL